MCVWELKASRRREGCRRFSRSILGSGEGSGLQRKPNLLLLPPRAYFFLYSLFLLLSVPPPSVPTHSQGRGFACAKKKSQVSHDCKSASVLGANVYVDLGFLKLEVLTFLINRDMTKLLTPIALLDEHHITFCGATIRLC